jgi:protein TonB
MNSVSQHLESRRARIMRWGAAALVICGLHAGALALALMQPPEQEQDADDVAGAMTVELAPLPAPAPVDSPDVAHGREIKEYSPPVPEASKKAEKKAEEDIPPIEPSPELEPEIALPKPQPKEKEEIKEEAQDVQQQPPREAKDDVTTAPPRVEAPPAPSAAAKSGQSLVAAQIQASWQRAVSKHLNRHKRYPEAARRQRLHGSATVRFVLDRSGQVVLSEIIKSSGAPVLDEEALATVKRASPVPVPPSDVEDRYLENFVRIDFNFR